MSAGWQVGDLALCVDNAIGDQEALASFLVVGKIYKVAEVGIPKESRAKRVCLAFREAVLGATDKTAWAFNADRFRKIRPDKQEPCETEFVTLLNRIKVSA